MEVGLSIYVVAGVTSNLFASLLAVLPVTYTIFATVRKETCASRVAALGQRNVQFITLEQGLSMVFSRVLWLSTHDDAELLTKFASATPTLAINSGAIMDLLMGKQAVETANPYQKSKLSLFNVPNVYSFIPGFYIEDTVVPSWASHGLHRDTNIKVFGIHGCNDAAFDWSKAYSVTPKSFITDAIKKWLENPTMIKPNTPVIVCSDRQYRRHELRHAVPFFAEANSPPLLEEVYASFPHFGDARVTHEMVKQACLTAAVLLHKKN